MQDDERPIIFSTRYLKTKIVIFLTLMFWCVQTLVQAASSADLMRMTVHCVIAPAKCCEKLSAWLTPNPAPDSNNKPLLVPSEPNITKETDQIEQPPEAVRETSHMPPVRTLDPPPLLGSGTCRKGIVNVLKVTEILIQFKPAKTERGVVVSNVDEQSVLKGWLCQGDIVVSVNGKAVEGSNSTAIGRDFDNRLMEKPDFEIVVIPIRPHKRDITTESDRKMLVCGLDIAESVERLRDC